LLEMSQTHREECLELFQEYTSGENHTNY
jgi:hypothetical protein